MNGQSYSFESAESNISQVSQASEQTILNDAFADMKNGTASAVRESELQRINASPQGLPEIALYDSESASACDDSVCRTENAYSNSPTEPYAEESYLPFAEDFSETYLPADSDDPDAPNYPEDPDVSNFPGDPDAANYPENPDVPKFPGDPDAPNYPEDPELPNHPDLPELPESPDLSESPESPELPEVFADPETSEFSEEPANPEIGMENEPEKNDVRKETNEKSEASEEKLLKPGESPVIDEPLEQVNRSFEFGKTGELDGFTENEEHWSRQPDGTFVKDGSNPPERRTNVEVTKDGDFSYKDEQTGREITDRGDGTRRVVNSDGSIVDTDKFGRIDAIKYASATEKPGAERFFEYDPETGELARFQENGDKWEKQKDGSFVKVGSNPPEIRTNVSVDPRTGDFTYMVGEPTAEEVASGRPLRELFDKAKTITESPDGRRKTEEPNGSFVITDINGRPIVVNRGPRVFVPVSGGL